MAQIALLQTAFVKSVIVDALTQNAEWTWESPVFLGTSWAVDLFRKGSFLYQHSAAVENFVNGV